jgi:HPt (histidine-containing phosphotransfer) domain-containing protein
MEVDRYVPTEALFSERIKHLTKLYYGGNREIFKRVCMTYSSQSPLYLTNLERAVKDGDSAAAKNELHRWRPALTMLGFQEFHDFLEQFERALMVHTIESSGLKTEIERIAKINARCVEHIALFVNNDSAQN